MRTDLRNEPLIGKGLLANRTLITDGAARPRNLGACLEFAAGHSDVPRWLRSDALSAKPALVRMTGIDPAKLPTDPTALRPIFATVQPIRFNLSNKRWQNIKTVLTSALILSGWISVESRKRYVLPSPWADLLAVASTHDLDRALAPFFRFCIRTELTPQTITSETLHAYMEWVTESTLKANSRQTAHWVQSSWSRMQPSIPNGQRQKSGSRRARHLNVEQIFCLASTLMLRLTSTACAGTIQGIPPTAIRYRLRQLESSERVSSVQQPFWLTRGHPLKRSPASPLW